MRPVGEVRQALLQACAELAAPERGATLREMAHRACVGVDAARRTVSDMHRARQIRAVGWRKVDYRNRPVAEYAPAAPEQSAGFVDLADVMNAWGG